MAVDLGPFELAAPPGTEVDWVLQECNKVGLRQQSNARVFNVFLEENTNKFRLSLVRHPCDWLIVCYHLINCMPPPISFYPIPDFEPLQSDGTFETFVRNYLKHMPGEVGRVFDSYKCDCRMRLEDMPWALVEFLESVGVSEEKLKLISDPKLMLATSRRWDEKLFQEVIEAESELCLTFDYY